MWLKCLKAIQKFKLFPSSYPPVIGFMGRKQSVDFNDTTLETWKSIIPGNTYQIKAGDKEILVAGSVKVQYGGFDTSESVKKFQSAEYAHAFVDQAEEISRDDYGLIKGTLRKQVHGAPLDYKILLTANPADCWIKDEFINRLMPGNAFIQALPSDNGFLPKGYIQNLKEAFRHRPELVEAYVHGRWDVLTGFDLVIKPEWVRKCIDRTLFADPRRVIVCDPARFGDDETVIYAMEGYKIIDTMIYGERSTMETAGNLIAMQNKHNAELIAVDVCGLGAGIVDRLYEQGKNTIEINSSSRPTIETEAVKHLNLRAQMWWEAGVKISNEQVSIPNDQTLINQLTTPKYKLNSRGLIQIEGKAEIKDRLGSSPDRADAFVMGLHAIDHINTIKEDFYRQPALQPHDSYGWTQLLGANR